MVNAGERNSKYLFYPPAVKQIKIVYVTFDAQHFRLILIGIREWFFMIFPFNLVQMKAGMTQISAKCFAT